MKIKVSLFIICSSFFSVFGQDDLDSLLGSMEEEKVEYVTGTFKSTRVINLHTVETAGKNTLDFRISHRFGSFDQGAYQLFGLDQATMRLGFEYGVTEWLMVGVGRSTYEKTYDGFLKAILLKQSKGKRVIPVTVAYLATTTINALKWPMPNRTNLFSSRIAYVHQLIIASKINKSISVQLSPTIVHENLVPTKLDKNTNYALGFSGRVKTTKRTAITFEYIYRIPPTVKTDSYNNYYNSMSVGYDIETGGHVFSLHVSNSLPMIEKGFIFETNKSWLKNGIHFGFNVSRVFLLKKE